MTMNVTSSDSGIDTAETSVERSDARNSRITTTAKRSPSRPSVARPSMDSSMNGAWSNTTSTRTSWASSTPERSSTASWTACDTSTVLPAGVLVMATASAGSPSSRENDVAGSGPAVTVATSPSATGGVPGAAVGDTRGSAASSSTVVTAVPTCTLRVRSPSATAPAGTTTPLSWRIVETCCGLSPAAASAAGSRAIVTCWSATPLTATLRTPSTSSSAGTRLDVTVSASAASSAPPDTASWMTGRSSTEPVTTCGSTSSGSWDCSRVTAVWSCEDAASMSVPYANWTVVTERPVDDVDVTSSTPLTPRAAVSTGTVTCCSTIAGAEPGYAPTTAAVGICRLG